MMMNNKMGASDNEEGFRAGNRILDIVNKAINSGDYSSLDREITNVLNKAADAVHDTVNEVVTGKGDEWFRRNGARTYRSAPSSSYEDAKNKVRCNGNDPDERNLFAGPKGALDMAVPVARAVLGGAGTFFFALFFIGGLAISGRHQGAGLFAVFFGACAVFSGWNLWKGSRKFKMIKRAGRISKMMGNRDTITVREISSAFGQDERETASDIRAMIREGAFDGNVYMDEGGTAFMTSHEAYSQYLATMDAYEQRKAAEGKSTEGKSTEGKSVFSKSDLREYNKMQEGAAVWKNSEKRKREKLDREKEEMICEGRAFIAHIHQKNEEVPAEKFSNELNRLETIVTSIFDRVATQEKNVPDLHRMMKYYIPTTQKLIDTYAELDKQKVKGENIEIARKEIEDSLGTINDAFEKFLDSFFRTTAWDVSSDISVMNQMMVQDGLTDSHDFDIEEPREKDLYAVSSGTESAKPLSNGNAGDRS